MTPQAIVIAETFRRLNIRMMNSYRGKYQTRTAVPPAPCFNQHGGTAG
jgi:hypothetical protein